jgi:hypothetical protein
MSDDFQAEIQCLGTEAPRSFVGEPVGDGVAERFIRTLKENLLWVRTFRAVFPPPRIHSTMRQTLACGKEALRNLRQRSIAMV